MSDPFRTDVARNHLADPFNEGAKAAKARKMRSMAIALGLVLFVLLIFAVSILKLMANAAQVHALPHG